MNDQSGIDPSGLARLQRMGGPSFVRKMITLFLQEAPERLAAARTGASTGDFGAVAEAAHALKSSAHNFGAVRLASIAANLESQAAASGEAALSLQLNDLEKAYAEARTWLETARDAISL